MEQLSDDGWNIIKNASEKMGHPLLFICSTNGSVDNWLHNCSGAKMAKSKQN